MPISNHDLRFGEAKKKRSGVYIHCIQCGILFYLPPSRAKRHEQFCSRKCQSEFASVTKECPVCHKEFTVNKSIAYRYTVCSDECRRAQVDANGLKVYSGLVHTCERCGKKFTTSEKRYDRHFCSEECRRPTRIVKCEVCGKEFRAIPSDVDRRFCSFACYRKSHTETSIEKLVRLELEAASINHVQEYKQGRYSIDFYLPESNIALEVDGTYWHQNKARDERKTKFLSSKGLRVVRIAESEIRNAHNLDRLIMDKLQI